MRGVGLCLGTEPRLSKWSVPNLTIRSWGWPHLNHFFFKDFIISFFSPTPPVHSCTFFVVGPSSCGMWDATSAWFDEQCHVRAQDSNQRNTGPPAAERADLTTRPWGQPPG